MRTLYLDCGMGAAGDMLMGALVSLLPTREEQEAFAREINAAGIPHAEIFLSEDEKCGIVGTHVTVRIGGAEEHSHDVHAHGHFHELEQGEDEHFHGQEHHHDPGHPHDHEHHHDHKHPHHHATMAEIDALIAQMKVSERVKADVRAVYRILAEAESRVHGKPVTEVHFHEVGMMDALCDITGCALLIEKLAPEKILASPIQTGYGKVRCAHGILPVPAPATLHILEGIPCYAGDVEGELCTPTGAALLKYYADAFSHMPPMVIGRSGYGTGTKDFPSANVIRAILGETAAGTDEVIEYAASIDDMTPEELAFAAEILRERGALEVYTTAIAMKKARHGILFTVMCREEKKEEILSLLFRHTTTIGVRERRCSRIVMRREMETVLTPCGDVRVKVSSGYGATRRKAEYEDLKKIALKQDITLREARRLAENAFPEGGAE